MTAVVRFPAQVSRLVTLLGSPSDGEALGAARALDRTLRAAGLDFHALANVIDRAVEPTTYHRERDIEPTSWSTVVRWCREHDHGRLNPKEHHFVRDMAARLVVNGQPTERQADWLRSIYFRLKKMERAV